MDLTINQSIIINKIRDFIVKNYPKDQIEKIKCNNCNGFGLKNVSHHITENISFYSWDCKSFCDTCKGIGYLNVTDINNEYYSCTKCKGTGLQDSDYDNQFSDMCTSCNGKGFVDYIKNVFYES